jgi:hypothetical protein
MRCADKLMTPAMNNKTLERRKMLSGGIKLLIGIGVLFLLVPFFRSITWSESPVPENNTLVNNHDLVAGVAQAVNATGWINRIYYPTERCCACPSASRSGRPFLVPHCARAIVR